MMYFTLIALPKITFYSISIYSILVLFVLLSIYRLKSKNSSKLKFYKVMLIYGKKIIKCATPILFSLILICVITSISNNLKLGPDAIHFSGIVTTILMMIYLLKKCIYSLKKME